MGSSKEFAAFVLDQLDQVPGLSYRAMMGEYILYCRGLVFGGIFDDCLLIKITAAGRQLLPEAEEAIPYPGGKPKLLVENLDDKEFLRELVLATCAELPPPKPKRNK